MKNKKVIIVLGPTAVGKTAFAIQLAKQFHTSIISSDSRQCFKELNIGVAKPSETELQTVLHYFINSHSVKDEMNAALFEQLALQWADEIFKKNNVLVMVGGTGLYIKAFCEGLDDVPPVSEKIREEIRDAYEKNGLPWLQDQIKINDPLFYNSGEILNPQRVMRALEVKMATGNSILSYRKKNPKERPFEIQKIGLELPKNILHRNINTRVDMMMEQGLADEVKALMPFRHLNALRTVGYSELFDWLDGKTSLDEAVELIKQHTRQYAKRQMTWFKKDPEVKWMNPDRRSV
ncbi:MAG: tRNA (adenosine(37)-N6)-dimethylallyltransferase MiaA [Bacteroidetes bacterium]|nr:tRNA (adenosine(37)-N6)-dimethylallyltransferase MiaA [Bacteroidota bacterium]